MTHAQLLIETFQIRVVTNWLKISWLTTITLAAYVDPFIQEKWIMDHH